VSEKLAALADTLAKQEEILSGLLGIVQKQREALKEGRLSDLQNLMSDMRHMSVRAQAIETKRARAVEDIASELGCAPVVSDITRAAPRDESAEIKEAAGNLLATVDRLKMEMSILSRLMEETKSLNEMMINEWRRLGAKAAGMAAGSFDTKV
jgi:flagellar biosynthesis/type III secretory pathway chaperone